MASIWIEAEKHKAAKLVGNLPIGGHLNARFKIEVAKAAKRYDATLVYQDGDNALLQPKDKSLGNLLFRADPIAMWIELCSPPSAPENNQPKLMKGRGVLVAKGEIHDMGVPTK